MNKRFLLVLAVVAAAGFGCDKKAEGNTEAATETKLTDDDVPVKGDFVEEAEGSITPSNYKSELDKLGEEIDKE